MDGTDYQKTADQIQDMITRFGVSKPSQKRTGASEARDVLLAAEKNLVVDLGCGTGKLTEILADRGYDVMGIDLSEEMLGIALERRDSLSHRTLYLCQDMREFELYGTAGTFVSVGDSVNYGNYLLTERSPFLARMYDLVQDQMKQLTGGPIWLSLLTTAVLAPVFEEWLCRGMVLRGLLQKKSPATAIVLSALFFAALHLNPWQALNAFIIGCLLGYVYYRTGSLWLTMLMHATNNALAVVMSHIDSLEDVEYFIDVMSPGAYAAVMAVSIAVLCGVVVLFRRIPLERPQGNCDEVVEELPESVA